MSGTRACRGMRARREIMVAVVVTSVTCDGDDDAAASCAERMAMCAERANWRRRSRLGNIPGSGAAMYVTQSVSKYVVFIICSSRGNNNKTRAAYTILAGTLLYHTRDLAGSPKTIYVYRRSG